MDSKRILDSTISLREGLMNNGTWEFIHSLHVFTHKYRHIRMLRQNWKSDEDGGTHLYRRFPQSWWSIDCRFCPFRQTLDCWIALPPSSTAATYYVLLFHFKILPRLVDQWESARYRQLVTNSSNKRNTSASRVNRSASNSW